MNNNIPKLSREMSADNGTKPHVGGSTVKVEISRVLCDYGWKPFVLYAYPHKVKRAGEKFNTLAELKDYYQIKKIVKTGGTGWAISPRGKRHEWSIYEAEISTTYVM